MALYINGKEYVTQAILLPDDESISPGAAKILYETADANANALIFVAPEGGATDVPAFIFGDASIENVDLTWFNGLTEPSLVVVNDAKDAYVRIDAGDDAVAGSQGIYFKAAADEDIELLNLSVTGTPRWFWDESEDAFVFTKNLYTGGNIRFNSQFLLKYLGTNDLGLRNTADSGYADLSCGTLNQYSTIAFQAADLNFNAYNTDAATLIGNARDSTVGMVKIWRMVGAADPFFEIGRDDTGVATSAITDGLVLQMGAGSNNEAAGQGFGISVKIGNAASELEERGQIDLRLVTATNGAEDTGWDVYTMAAGTANLAFKIDQNGELYGDADSSSGAYMVQNVNLFDSFDDVTELRRFQLTVPRTGLISEEQRLANRQRMVELGIFEENPKAHSGYMMRMQQMTRLLAGGIWQTRQSVSQLEDKVAQLEAKIGA